jgi:hypothetical protein
LVLKDLRDCETFNKANKIRIQLDRGINSRVIAALKLVIGSKQGVWKSISIASAWQSGDSISQCNEILLSFLHKDNCEELDLVRHKYSPAFSEAVIMLLESTMRLRSLRLVLPVFQDDDPIYSELANAIRLSKTLDSISLLSYPPVSSQRFGEAICANANIKNIAFPSSEYDHTQWIMSLLPYLVRRPEPFDSIEISSSSKPVLETIPQLLARNQVQSLTIDAYNGFDLSGYPPFLDALASNTSLKRLIVSGKSFFNCHGLQKLVHAIQSRDTMLDCLYGGYTKGGIDGDDFDAVVAVLSKLKIRRLHLRITGGLTVDRVQAKAGAMLKALVDDNTLLEEFYFPGFGKKKTRISTRFSTRLPTS